MKGCGIILWALLLTYLFCNKIFWYLWGTVLVVGLSIGIWKIIEENKKRK